MERIMLTKREKAVLRTLQVSDFSHLSDFDKYAVVHLHSLGLLQAVFEEGHSPVDAVLSTYGKEYLRANPKLRNPINKEWLVGTIISILTLLVAVLALFIACSRL